MMHRSRFLTAIVLLTLVAAPVLATVPAPDDLGVPGYLESWQPFGGPRDMPAPLGPFNYLREFDQMVYFLSTWQVDDPLDPNYGGMIEAESGDLGGVIQTDNTLEAIWCWSRYREFTGRSTYDANIAAAWVYCTNFPAWMEEGGGQEYYRVHNCAWGLTAVLQYEAATGDMQYRPYAETCAQYIVDHELIIDGTIWYQYLDAFCKGWACGNLYLYGESVGDPAYVAAAVAHGLDLKSWLDLNPAANMAAEYWAMSSGTSVWGVCNSVLLDDPALAASWIPAVYDYMPVYEDWHSVPGYVWDSSWNVAYMNAHFACWDLLGDQAYWDNGKIGADALLSLDTDDDGGITAESIDLADEDMTWVTCYLVKFGVDRLMGDPEHHDVGVLRFVGLDNGDRIMPGESVPLIPLATNYGLSDETGVTLRVTGDLGEFTIPLDLAFAELDTVVIDGAIVIPNAGTYNISAYTQLPGDQDASNDAVNLTFYVGALSSAPGDQLAAALGCAVTVNPFRESTAFRFALAAGAPVSLTIFDVRGRRVASRDAGTLGSGPHAIAWDGSDDSGEPLSAGLYLYRIAAGERSETGKLLRLR